MLKIMEARKAVGRILFRKYSSVGPDGKLVLTPTPEAEKAGKLWEKLTLFVGLPAIGLGLLNTYLMKKEEEKTVKRPEYVPYEYLHKRNGRKYPWGDGNHTFFHNPHRNVLPGIGYEADEE